jgi:cytochrome c oxidase subunit 2
MTLGNTGRMLTKLLGAMMLLFAVPHVAMAQETIPDSPVNAASEATPAAVAAEPSVTQAAPGANAAAYTPLGPEWIKGKPTDGGVWLQHQYSPIGAEGQWMNDWILMPVMVGISILVLVLLLWVIVRYNRRSNPVATKTSHNTMIEVIWTVVPALILLAIAVPSIRLLTRQYESPPESALTVKVTGYQWYWGYTYPDNGGFEVISNMLPKDEALERGEPALLAVDNRLVIPVGEWIRVQTTGADVIHSFAVPSLWFKLDAVPGRLNEGKIFVKEPGIYYGQCSELCGARHGYMPIAIEAVPRAKFNQWILSQGGTPQGAEEAAPPAAAPPQEPESAIPDAPGTDAPSTGAPAAAGTEA